jgi:PhzF family phenazine biosynthesis protein
MKLPIFQIDAFTDNTFSGNPAAVVPLERWLPDDVMLNIAIENAVAETAFFIPHGEGFAIRWFTPDIEMDLCGHATLAAAHVITRHLNLSASPVRFQSQSGELAVRVDEDLLTLDFPTRKPEPCDVPRPILESLQEEPLETLKARDYILVYENETVIRSLSPDRTVMDQVNLDPGGVAVTARGDQVDFVSRFFTPGGSIFEDPVTGSAHCSLIPYWSEKLGKLSMQALQVSPRGGKLFCQNAGDRVLISGRAVTYLQGTITL